MVVSWNFRVLCDHDILLIDFVIVNDFGVVVYGLFVSTTSPFIKCCQSLRKKLLQVENTYILLQLFINLSQFPDIFLRRDYFRIWGNQPI